jgi:RND family efflux transporter MFP subunit
MLLIALAVLLPAAFLVGRLSDRGRESRGTAARQVLYYVDPMNPSFRSPGPGTAPCGMPLEPVYADGGGAGAAAPAGAVRVPADRLQLFGVARATVAPTTVRHTLRLLGTVAADETRLFRISAATAGRVREMAPVTTGTMVEKGQVLGAYYATELLVPQQNFLRMYEVFQEVQKTGGNPRDNFQGGGQLATYWRNVDVARQALMNLGMSAQQIDEVAASRQPAYLVQMRAPAAGVVTGRNVVLGQSFGPGEELFAIADLSRVWVLADAFEGQEELFRPGAAATVATTGGGRRVPAVVSAALPRFESATRTLKVRLEVANPDYALRPDMFVDVELPVEVHGIFVPKDAVLASGTRTLVFVEQGEGVFVPRAVMTGRRLGDLVEIRGGLVEGEKVVTAGNFLLDSESRMRAAATAAAGATLDPVCGMEVDEAKARARGLVSQRDGAAWYFCSSDCKETFDRRPVGTPAGVQGQPPPAPGHDRPGAASAKAFMAVDPVCGMRVDPDEAAARGLVTAYQGAPIPFCSRECKQVFDQDPAAVLSQPARDRGIPAGR